MLALKPLIVTADTTFKGREFQTSIRRQANEKYIALLLHLGLLSLKL